MTTPPPLNRTDADFHDVDPVTHRPISGGHPDGVWLISILFGLAIAVTGLQASGAIVRALRGGEIATKDYLPFLSACVLFGPPLVFLLRRRKAALPWLVAVALVVVSGAVAMWLNAAPGAFGLTEAIRALLVCGAFVWIAFYARGLVRDKFLT